MGWHLIGHWQLPDSYKLLHLISEDSNVTPNKFRRKIVPKIWYFMVNAGAVHFLPFLGIYWRQNLGITTQQIGLLQALRPWVSAASGNVFTSLADRWNIHYSMLLVTFAVTMVTRGLMSIESGFGVTLVLSIIMEIVVSPMGVIVDTTVVAGSTKDGTYGRARLWASVGWGCFAPVAGLILTKYGIHTCFVVFIVIYASAIIPTLLIPAYLLHGAQYKLRGGLPEATSSHGVLATRAEGQFHGETHADTPREVNKGEQGSVVIIKAFNGGVKNHSGAARQVAETLGGATGVVNAAAAPPAMVADLAVVSASMRTPASTGIKRRSTCGHGEYSLSAETSISDSLVRVNRQHEQQATAAAAVEDKKLDGSLYSAAPHAPAPLLSLSVDARNTEHTCFSEIIILGPSQQDFVIIQNAPQLRDDVPREACNSPTISDGCRPAALPSMWRGLKGVLMDVHVLSFFFKALLMGTGNGIIGYLFLVLTDLGGRGTLLGLCLTANCIGEVPVFFFSGALIKRLGVNAAFNLAMAAYLLRLGCYALLPEYPTLWLVLPVELLQGGTFALAYSAGTVYCRRIAPKNLLSTVQSMFSGLYTGVGAGVGGVVGGMLVGSFSARIMFLSGAGVILVGWIIADAAYLIETLCRGVRNGVDSMQSHQPFSHADIAMVHSLETFDPGCIASHDS